MHWPARLFLSILLSTMLSVGWGQENIGLGLSNYLPTANLQLNPALIADSRVAYDIHLGGVSVFADQNIAVFEGENDGLYRATFISNEQPTFIEGPIARRGFADISIEGLSAAAVLGRSAIAISTRYRAVLQMEEVPDELGQMIYHSFRHAPLYDVPLVADGGTISSLRWGELGFTFAHMLKVSEQSHFNVGATVKRLFGREYVGLNVLSSDYEFDAIDLGITNLNGDYALGNADLGTGNGWAFELGAVYRKSINGRADYVPYSQKSRCTKSDYRYEVGLSLIDFGAIDFGADGREVQITDGDNILWENYDANPVSGINEIDSAIAALFEDDQNFSSVSSGSRVRLPGAIAVQFDYNYKKGWHIGAVLQHPVRGGGRYDLRRPRVLGIIPRYEKERFEVALPFSFYEYQGLRGGIALRWHIFTIGSDHFLPILLDTDQQSADLYFAFRIPIYGKAGCGGGKRRGKLIAPCWGG